MSAKEENPSSGPRHREATPEEIREFKAFAFVGRAGQVRPRKPTREEIAAKALDRRARKQARKRRKA